MVVRAAVEDGRVGDVWRIRGFDHEMVVERKTDLTVTLNTYPERQESGWGYGREDWANVVYRVREDLKHVVVGDVVRVYVPETDFYLLAVNLDARWPVLSTWFGFQVGRWPDLEDEDSGLSFHPAEDESFDFELVFRPFAMVDDGALVRDSRGETWTYAAPFFFVDDGGERGWPQWPVDVPGDERATAAINATSPQEEVAAWARHAGVDPSVFGLRHLLGS